MKVLVTGYKEVDFEDAKGKPVKGINLYIVYPDEYTVGQIATKQWVRAENVALCSQILGLDFSQPFYADLIYDLVPNRKPVFVGLVPESAGKASSKATA